MISKHKFSMKLYFFLSIFMRNSLWSVHSNRFPSEKQYHFPDLRFSFHYLNIPIQEHLHRLSLFQLQSGSFFIYFYLDLASPI